MYDRLDNHDNETAHGRAADYNGSHIVTKSKCSTQTTK